MEDCRFSMEDCRVTNNRQSAIGHLKWHGTVFYQSRMNPKAEAIADSRWKTAE
jgi:hypothetical protein